MIKPPDQLLRQLAEQLASAVQKTVEQTRDDRDDIEKLARSLLQTSLAKLDMVSREEFDAQSRVLARTRERLEQAEKQLAELIARQP